MNGSQLDEIPAKKTVSMRENYEKNGINTHKERTVWFLPAVEGLSLPQGEEDRNALKNACAQSECRKKRVLDNIATCPPKPVVVFFKCTNFKGKKSAVADICGEKMDFREGEKCLRAYNILWQMFVLFNIGIRFGV